MLVPSELALLGFERLPLFFNGSNLLCNYMDYWVMLAWAC